jgi:hypothetical protein
MQTTGKKEEAMSRFSHGRSAASAWILWFITVLVLGGCRADGPTDPSATLPVRPSLASASKPIHVRDDLSFSGVVPCADAGIDIDATFDDHITVSITERPGRLHFHIAEVLTLRNVATGETVIGRFAGNQTLKISPTDVLEISTGQNTFKNSEGRIIHHGAGRVIFSQATGEVVFESGLHEGWEPDFLTAVCTELS